MTRNEAPATTNYYALSSADAPGSATRRVGTALKRLAPLMADEKRTRRPGVRRRSSSRPPTSLLAPVIIGHTVDTLHPEPELRRRPALVGASCSASIVVGLCRELLPDAADGHASAGRVLFKLRNALFTKLQELPLDFFNQNKAGDLISRINNDTDKLNQFFSQSLVQLAGNLFMMTGAAIFLLTPQSPPRRSRRWRPRSAC